MRLFFITSRFPWPITKGDQLRAYNQIKGLSKNHEIILFSLSEEPVSGEYLSRLKPFCVHIEVFYLKKRSIYSSIMVNAFSKLPVQIAYHYNSRAAKRLKTLEHKFMPDKMIFQLIRMAPYAKFFPEKKCIIDLMDCLSYHYLLRSKLNVFPEKIFFDVEYRLLKRYEAEIIDNYSNILVISKKDKDLLPGNTEKIQVIGNGVEDLPSPGNDKTIDLLFLGNMTYTPNINAALFLANKVMPLVWRLMPGLTLTIAGKDPSEKFMDFSDKRLITIANPPETTPIFNAARIFVAPMFLSTGVQNKILEAMAAGVPVITSPNAADALEAINGKELLTAISAEEFREKIIDLLTHPEKREKLSQDAAILIKKSFDWKHNIRLLENLLN